MEFKHLLFAGAVSLSLGSVAFAQQAEPGAQPQEPGVQAQPGAPGAGAEPGMPPHDQQTVRQVQEKLTQRGYEAGAADGVWGPESQQALTQFQQAEGLEATGQLDEQTLSALGIEEEAPSTMSPGMEQEETPRGDGVPQEGAPEGTVER